MSSVAILSLLALAGCSASTPPEDAPTSTDEIEAAATPAAGGTAAPPRLCAEFPEKEGHFPIDEVEGWWSATPVDPESGEVVVDPADWEDARMREHPRIAVVDTQSGQWVTWDRTICGESDEYAPMVDDGWPALSYVVVDMDSDELLESVDISAANGGEGLTTTTSALASVLDNGGVPLDAAEAAPYTELVVDAQDPDLGLRFASATTITAESMGGTYEAPSGVGFTFRVERGSSFELVPMMVQQPEPLEIDGGEGQTFGGSSWGFSAEAVADDGACLVGVHAMPVDTDVPPWPEGYDEHLATAVLPRLLATC